MGNNALSILFANSVTGSIVNFETLHRSIESEFDAAVELLSKDDLHDKLRGSEREFNSENLKDMYSVQHDISRCHGLIMDFSKATQEALLAVHEDEISVVSEKLEKFQGSIAWISEKLTSMSNLFESVIDDLLTQEIKILLNDARVHVNRVNDLLTHMYTLTLATERSVEQWLLTTKN